MKKNKSIDEVFEALDSAKRVNPSEDFLAKMKGEALSFVESRVRYKRKTLILFFVVILVLIVANLIVTNYYDIATGTATESTLDYELIPIKTIDYEEN